MITLNKNTKKAEAFLKTRESAKNNGNYSIYSIYARPSSKKISISREIENQFNDVVYHGGSSFTFTCSGIDKEGILLVFTKNNIYKILL